MSVKKFIQLNQLIQKEEIEVQAKVGVNSVSALGEDGKPIVQRRMSLKYRTASEKYIGAVMMF